MAILVGWQLHGHAVSGKYKARYKANLFPVKKKKLCCVPLLRIPCCIVSGQEAGIYKMANEQIRMSPSKFLGAQKFSTKFISSFLCSMCTVYCTEGEGMRIEAALTYLGWW